MGGQEELLCGGIFVEAPDRPRRPPVPHHQKIHLRLNGPIRINEEDVAKYMAEE